MYREGLPLSTADLVASVADRLTPTERRIAEAVLADPTLLAFGTVADLSDHVGTSRPSVVRFANKLGFDGYSQLQERVQRDLSLRLFRPSDRIRHASEPTAATARAALAASVTDALEKLDEVKVAEIADPIAEADAVWVFTGETSKAGARTLMSGLSIVRPRVRFIDAHTVGVDLADAEEGDIAVVFDFYRYRAFAVDTARAFSDAGIPIVAVTDGPLSPFAAVADRWIDLDVPAIGPFDSSVPSVASAELIVAHVARRLHVDATERIDRTEEMWAATATFTDTEDVLRTT